MKLFKSKKGFTLVEMSVCFILVALLLAATATSIASFSSIYSKCLIANRANNILNIVVDELYCTMISGYKINLKDLDANPGNGYEALEMEDKNGHPIIVAASSFTYLSPKDGVGNVDVTIDDGKLHIYYKEVKTANDEYQDAVNWSYGGAMYMGARIQDLKFVKPNDPGYLFSFEFTLVSEDGTEYPIKRYVECYNQN